MISSKEDILLSLYLPSTNITISTYMIYKHWTQQKERQTERIHTYENFESFICIIYIPIVSKRNKHTYKGISIARTICILFHEEEECGKGSKWKKDLLVEEK